MATESPLIARLKAIGDAPALAKMANVDQSAAYRWLSGDRSPHAKTLKLIAEASGVSLEWLQTGTGEMRPPEDSVDPPSPQRRYIEVPEHRRNELPPPPPALGPRLFYWQLPNGTTVSFHLAQVIDGPAADMGSLGSDLADLGAAVSSADDRR